jgi:hypothetical protein
MPREYASSSSLGEKLSSFVDEEVRYQPVKPERAPVIVKSL